MEAVKGTPSARGCYQAMSSKEITVIHSFSYLQIMQVSESVIIIFSYK
jgi:hypothetical protein